MALIRIHYKSVKVREVFRSQYVWNRLEAVGTEVQIFEILEIDEIRMERCKTICSDSKPLETSELSDMLAGVKAAEEVVGI